MIGISRRGFVGVFAGVLLLGGIGQGRLETQAVQREHHESIVRLVLVDVIATDKAGRAITGLTRDDFEVFEDGKRMEIHSLEFVSFEEEGEHVSILPAPPPRPKRFFVVFDSINTVARMLDRDRARILDELVELIRSGGEAMVLEMTEDAGIRVLQPFSSDPQLVAQAVEQASGNIWIDRTTDDLAVPSIFTRGDPIRRDPAEQIAPPGAGMEKSTREIYQYRSRIRFEKSLSALLSLMTLIKDYPGRKPVLLVSGGFPELSLEGVVSTPGIESKVGHSDLDAAKIFDPFKILQKRGRRYGDDILNDLLTFANSHNISFYGLDPDNYLRYVLPDISLDGYRQLDIAKIKQSEQANLRHLSLATGGISLLGSGRYEEFRKVMERDLTSFYELSYVPDRKKPSGRHHKIQVRVNQPGVQLRFRSGYTDYHPDQGETLLFAATAANPDLFRGIDFQARVIPFFSGRNAFMLWIHMALPVQDLLLRVDPADNIALIKAGLWMDARDRRNAFDARLDIPIVLTPAFRKQLEQARFFGYSICTEEIRLPQDRYRFVFTLYDEESGRAGTVVQDLEIPERKATGEPQIANVVFGLLRETGESGRLFALSPADGTLHVDGFKFHPMGAHRFGRKEKVSVFLQVLAPDIKGDLRPEFVIVRDGRELDQVPAELVRQQRDRRAQVVNIVCTLDFSRVSPGGHELHIRLRDSSPDGITTITAPIQIF